MSADAKIYGENGRCLDDACPFLDDGSRWRETYPCGCGESHTLEPGLDVIWHWGGEHWNANCALTVALEQIDGAPTPRVAELEAQAADAQARWESALRRVEQLRQDLSIAEKRADIEEERNRQLELSLHRLGDELVAARLEAESGSVEIERLQADLHAEMAKSFELKARLDADALAFEHMRRLLRVLLESRQCLAPDGLQSEIPEEISGQFCISLNDARSIESVLAVSVQPQPLVHLALAGSIDVACGAAVGSGRQATFHGAWITCKPCKAKVQAEGSSR